MGLYLKGNLKKQRENFYAIVIVFLIKMYIGCREIITKISQVVQYPDPDKFNIFLPCLQGNEMRTLVLGEAACTKHVHRRNITIKYTGLLN